MRESASELGDSSRFSDFWGKFLQLHSSVVNAFPQRAVPSFRYYDQL